MIQNSLTAFKVFYMFGSKRKHKIFSGVLLFLAAVVFVGMIRSIYLDGAVSFDTVSSFGSVIFLLSFALIPEFVFLKLSQAFKVTMQSRREKLSEKLLIIGMVLVVIGFIGKVAL